MSVLMVGMEMDSQKAAERQRLAHALTIFIPDNPREG